MEISKRTDWDQMIKEVKSLIEGLRYKPKSKKALHYLDPGSILNAFREGDLTFDEAITELKKWKGIL